VQLRFGVQPELAIVLKKLDEPRHEAVLVDGRLEFISGRINGDACRNLAAQFLALAKKDGTAAPLVVGYRMWETPYHLRVT
jgi:hypothetical protein